ncbi:MAG: ABC transporter permease [Candidatus Bipolaricaulaceae bacterium]
MFRNGGPQHRGDPRRRPRVGSTDHVPAPYALNEDCGAIASIEGVESAAFITRMKLYATSDQGWAPIMAFALPPKTTIVPGVLVEGRFFTEVELDQGAPYIVLGAITAQMLFPEGGAVGQTIKTEEQEWRVLGVFAPNSGTLGDLRFLEEIAYVPARALPPSPLPPLSGRIWVKIRSGYDVQAVLSEIFEVLRARHPGKAPAVIEGPAAQLHELVMLQAKLVYIFFLVALCAFGC